MACCMLNDPLASWVSFYYILQQIVCGEIKVFFFIRLSFGLAASKIKEKARVVSMDLRGHGKSYTDDDLDLSIEVVVGEIVTLLSDQRCQILIWSL